MRKRPKLHKGALAALLFVFCLLSPSLLRAGAPTEQVRATADKAIAILADSSLEDNERLERLREVVYPRFDFTEMAKRSLGSHWRSRTPEEQREFVRTFTELLEKSYADKIKSYSGEKVVYGKELQEGNFAQVDTKLVTKKGEEYSVIYKLHLVGGEWKVSWKISAW